MILDLQVQNQFDLPLRIVDCEWASWEGWMECTATCGGGVTLRTRRPNTCTNSLSCKGTFVEQQICNTESCPEFSTLSTDVAHLKRDGRYQLTFDYYYRFRE